ncbi:3-oxo-5-alpha-steroid 4-dehydrogenase [Pyrenophora tritici-repentis]|uniref:Polyprenal reductase n=3 Tax=Pyrenophora tritici-repentis TaxID=45151 RepID=A0A834S5N2_9PLEO|nr:3-oxo-5-alpha-steroid 4-dehydrogenase [Pyrenophora tritici-repentis]
MMMLVVMPMMQECDVAVLLRAFYIAASLLILAIHALPVLRARFLPYGSRATGTKKLHRDQQQQQPSAFVRALDYAAALQVPHNYFTHFYLTSVTCSLFWAVWHPLWQAQALQQAVWALLLLQGVRRMLESFAYMSSSKSTMSVAHWFMGLVFYLSINMAIWVETPANHVIQWALVPAVVVAQVLQHYYHAYLYRLRTQNTDYQLPLHPLFPNLLCPHYTCEVAIYALLSIIAAPNGSILNPTLACGTVFVATNLGVTAVGTKEWYVNKFGLHRVRSRKRMVPGLW